jgi:hemoglobin
MAREDKGRPTEEDIRRFVVRFYDAVRADAELAPIFADRIGERWDAHLDRMVDFWSSVLLASGRYRGDPLRTHRAIPVLESRHFDRWLSLFERTVGEVLEEPKARDVVARARRMRDVLDPGSSTLATDGAVGLERASSKSY